MRSPPHLDLIQQSREPWGRTRTHVEVEGGVLMTGRRLRDWRHDRILGQLSPKPKRTVIRVMRVSNLTTSSRAETNGE